MIGKDASTVQRAEKMHSSAKLETYQLCATALGVSLSDIFSDDLTVIERELIKAFRAFPADQRGGFVGLIEMAKARAHASDQSDDPTPSGSGS